MSRAAQGRSGAGKSAWVLLKLISGGQTGADRAALDFAIAARLTHGGWCPRERRAEDGRIPAKYKLRETPSRRYPQRTRRNVIDADATVILSKRPLVGGTILTARMCRLHGRPLIILSPARPIPAAVRRLRRFLRAHKVQVLNVAGPRASTDACIYSFTYAVLGAALRRQPRACPERRSR
jgi:hypothetical protein